MVSHQGTATSSKSEPPTGGGKDHRAKPSALPCQDVSIATCASKRKVFKLLINDVFFHNLQLAGQSLLLRRQRILANPAKLFPSRKQKMMNLIPSREKSKRNQPLFQSTVLPSLPADVFIQYHRHVPITAF